MNNVKKNNKGFSLVELIVVVLIMAIIAVALAPQVMKWVGHSKVAADVSNYDSLVSECQLALTTSGGYTAVTGGSGQAYTLEMGASGTTLKKGTGATATTAVAGDGFFDALTGVDASWSKVKAKNGTTYTITINANGTVSRTSEPDGSGVTN